LAPTFDNRYSYLETVLSFTPAAVNLDINLGDHQMNPQSSLATVLSASINALQLQVMILDRTGVPVFVSRELARSLGGTGEPNPNWILWPQSATDLKSWREGHDQLPVPSIDVNTALCSASGEVLPVRLLLIDLGSDITLVQVLAGLSKRETNDPIHGQRLELLGMLAGGVAHDFNNVLAGILGHVTYLKMILPTSGAHVESLAAIEDGGRKASSMTQQILNFSRLEADEEISRVDVGSLITKSCNLVRASIAPEHSLVCEVKDQNLTAIACEGKLAQVIVNLVINARDASKKGGVVRVHVADARERTELTAAFGTNELPAARYVRLTVSDRGHGIPKEVIGRVFEPYFSTKRGKGTGLGLSTVATIVRESGGAITIASQVDQGTTVAVFLPIIEGHVEAEARSGAGGEPQLRGGQERILVVDDESAVRNVLALSLQHLGYDVEVAASGAEGLAKYKASESGFDLVILDMLMPHLSGSEVFFRLLERDPQVRVLLVSGFSSEEAVQSVLDGGGLGFLQKPFTIEELSSRVRTCLDLVKS